MATKNLTNEQLKMESDARKLIDSMQSCYRQPVWMFCILLIGGIIGPVGGLIDAIINPHPLEISDFLAWIVLILLIVLSTFVFAISMKRTCFDGNGISVDPFFGKSLFVDWVEIKSWEEKWYGVILKTGNPSIRLAKGDAFYIQLIDSCLIWTHRFVAED